ncbi:alpha beta hydrolase, putative [Perkinsus marinus ATCC 50983]|uniref:Alpha beta hydrolase, putative n=1 Tax=Perkinsus marinus (strain ATCC 50983 / TXsc) TaxID=423536 RepID=C5LZF0_PERM5|nr:alpha beta hydrolase, putative [Perkinsus marinus ATCC 50983]EEQ97944.1 alpha beta hydrolase, putative [Perkinsus marinus ATCC 50983]|eukprot:XP_002765227.1 alpha beta hydrolase, putative [Perkinsus marinus ATCC 50983]
MDSSIVEERVQFMAPSGDHLLSGILMRPSRACNSVVIVCHGLFCDKDHPLVSSIAEAFVTQLGVCSFRFDFSANGESPGEWDGADYYQEVLEVDAAVLMLQQGKGLKTICVLGHSKGGTVVNMYAGALDVVTQVPMVVSLSARFDLSVRPEDRFSPSEMKSLEEVGYCDIVKTTPNGERVYRWWKESLQKISAINMRSIVESSATKKEDMLMMFIHAVDDKTVPVSDLTMFADTYDRVASGEGKRCIKMQLPAGGHSFKYNEERQQFLVPLFEALRSKHLV